MLHRSRQKQLRKKFLIKKVIIVGMTVLFFMGMCWATLYLSGTHEEQKSAPSYLDYQKK